jgi:hypothetical protein
MEFHTLSMNTFYKLSSTTMNPCTMVKSGYEQARKTWLCTGCAFPRPDTKVVDAAIQEKEPDNVALNFIGGCGLGIVRKDFLLALGEDTVREHLHLGSVGGPDGRLLEDWVTFVGRHRIIVRGSKNAGVRLCSECGRTVYFAIGQLYLYPKPPYGVSIFDAGNGGLVVTGELVGRVKLNSWRKLDCTRLPVLEAPRDGLVELKGP